MKRFNVIAGLLGVFFASALTCLVFASSPLEITVSTVIPNGSTNGSNAFTISTYPVVSGNVKIRKLFFSNDGAAERVTLWKTCTSSTSAVAVWDGIVPSSTTASVSPGNLEVDWLPNGNSIGSPCIHKGLNGSGTVKAHISYE